MKTGSFFAILVAVLVQLTACNSPHKIYPDNNDDSQPTQNNLNSEKKLVQAAASISSSLAELAAIERSSHPQKKLNSPLDPNIIGMDQLVSIDWSGPIAPLVNKIATTAKYKLNILGTAPSIPILVSISAKNTLLADILRDANFQCGNKANIVVYPASKVIELRYVKL